MTESTTEELQAAISKQNYIIQSLVQQRNKALDDVVVMQADLAAIKEQMQPTNGQPAPATVESPDGEEIE
jgi:hypothetical protein